MTDPSQADVGRIVAFFESLAPMDLDRLDRFYTADARFKDPFNDVRGTDAIRRIFAHMFETLESPRFVITGQIVQGRECFLRWEFRFGMRRWRRGQPQTIVGGSHLQLAPDGRIELHRDYWDAAEELYEKLPLVGGLMRWLKRQANS